MTIKISPIKALLAVVVFVAFAAESISSFAAQIRIVEDNAEIDAVISSREVSRIALQDDRIIGLSAVPLGFSIDHDVDTGDLFLVPVPGAEMSKAVNIFITSEQGYSYQLLLRTMDVASEQILIRNPKAKSSAERPLSPRRQELAQLIRGVITGALIDGYKRIGTSPDTIIVARPDILPVETWQGEIFKASRLKSINGTPLTSASSLMPDAAAVWVSLDQQEAIIVMEVGSEY